jgi:hypothetical protein
MGHSDARGPLVTKAGANAIVCGKFGVAAQLRETHEAVPLSKAININAISDAGSR